MDELIKELERLKGLCEGDDFKCVTIKSEYSSDRITITNRTDVSNIVSKLYSRTKFTNIKYIKEYGKTQVIIGVN